MSPISKKIAQMFIVALPFTMDENELYEQTEKYIEIGIGGIMLGIGGKLPFAEKDSVTDIEKLKKITARLRTLDPSLFIAIDGEGGEIFNLFENISTLKPQRYYGLEFEKSGSTEEYERDLKEYINLMKEVGINMNFAPILDTAKNGYKGYLSEHERAYSDKSEIVKKLSGISIGEMQKKGIIAVGKHFPGYGHITKDPHSNLSTANSDFIIKNKQTTFSYAISEYNINAIMKGHVLSPLDRNIPATVSEKTEKYLREVLKFTGLSITDQIFMDSLGEYYDKYGGDKENNKRAINSAKVNDLILMSYPKNARGEINIDNHNHFPKLHRNVIKAVEKGEIYESKIDESFDRIMKYKYDIINSLSI